MCLSVSMPVTRTFSQALAVRPTRAGKYAISNWSLSSRLPSSDVPQEAGLRERASGFTSAREITKGRRQGGEGGEKHVVYPVMADTRTGRCNSRRQHTYSKTLEKAHGYPSLPYHHTGEYPRTNATHHFSFHRGRTPGCFCPVDPDGQSCPGSCRTRILLTEKVLLPPCNIDGVPHTRVTG